MPKQQLKDMDLDEISFVDVGANQLAKVVLTKRLSSEDVGKDDDVEKAPAGIQFVIGFKEGGGSEVQSVIFDSSKWDAERAKKWLEDHDMSAGKVDEKENTLRFRQHDPEGYTRFRVIQPGKQVAKALKAKQSFNQVQAVVDRAVREKYQKELKPGDPAISYLWVRDLFKDSVVFDMDGATWRSDYTVERDDNGDLQVSIGEKIPVDVVYADIGKEVEEPPPPEPPKIPPELLFKLGRLEAGVRLVGYRINKFSQQQPQMRKREVAQIHGNQNRSGR